MVLQNIERGMSNAAETINSNFKSIDSDKQNATYDTGWLKVTTINGWQGNIEVRQVGNTIYHKGNYYSSYTGSIKSDIFKYPAPIKFDANATGVTSYVGQDTKNNTAFNIVFVDPKNRSLWGNTNVDGSKWKRLELLVYSGGKA